MNARILLLALGMAASGMNSLLIAGLLPAVAETLNSTEPAVGLSVAVHACLYALTAPFMPIAFSRFTRKSVIIGSLAVLVVSLLLSAAAWDLASFYVARALGGVATAAFTAQAIATAIEISPPNKKGAAATWVTMGFAVSMALGVPVGTLLGGLYGYRVAFLLTAAVAATALLGLALSRIDVRAGSATLREQFRPFGSPVVLSVMAFTLLYATAFFGVLTYLYPILEASIGASGATVAAALAIFGICNIISMFIGGKLIDRFSGLAVIFYCLVIMGLVTPLIGAPVGVAGVFLAVAAFGLTGALVGPATNVELGYLYPQNPATVVGATMAAVQLGAVAGSAAGAALLSGPGAQWIAFASGPSALLAAAICFGLLYRRRRIHVNQPEGVT